MNQDALGFQPLGDLAQENQLDLGGVELSNQLSKANYPKLTRGIASLGHLGEGHCALVAN